MNGTVFTVPCSLPAGVAMKVSPLAAAPEDEAAWQARIMLEGIPPGTRVRVLERRVGESNHGWPMAVHHAVVVDEASGRVLETRVVAFYRYLQLVGHVVVSLGDAACWQAHREGILRLLADARPAFSTITPPPALVDLLPDEEDHVTPSSG